MTKKATPAVEPQKKAKRGAVIAIGAIVLIVVLALLASLGTPTPLPAPATATVLESPLEPPTEEGPTQAAPTQVVTATLSVGVAGFTEVTLTEYLSDTVDVGALIAVLDRDWETQYSSGQRGEWSAPTIVQCSAIAWTDFHGEPPAEVETVRREGGWGVYRFKEGFETPPNTAGRWICLAPAP